MFPHDTIWLRGGTYKGDYSSRLSGEMGRPLVVRQFPGERATIDGRLDITGSHTVYWGFEITYSDTRRVSLQSGSDPTDVPRESKVVFVTGPFNKLVNLVIHDLGGGVSAYLGAEGLEIYGCIIYNNGWDAPDRGHGHNLYLQNLGATKRVVDNVIFNSFSQGLHVYGSSATSLMNFLFEGNSIFGSGDPVASTKGTTDNIVQYGATPERHRNITYILNSVFHRAGNATAVRLNVAGQPPGSDLSFSDNVVHGKTDFSEWKNYTVTRNLFTSGLAAMGHSDLLLTLRFALGQSPAAHTWQGNSYAGTPNPGHGATFYVTGAGAPTRFTFPQWRSFTSYDATGSYSQGMPLRQISIVRHNKYEPDRAFITVWNFPLQASATVDPSPILAAGDRYTIHHVFDLWGPPVASGVYRGSPLTLPLATHTPPVPIGLSTAPPSPGHIFNVFVLRKH